MNCDWELVLCGSIQNVLMALTQLVRASNVSVVGCKRNVMAKECDLVSWES